MRDPVISNIHSRGFNPYCYRLAGIKNDDQGQQYHGQGNNDRSDDRSCPCGGDQEEDIPGHEGGRPVDQYFKEHIIKDIPDGKAIDKPGKPGSNTAPPGIRPQQHNDGGCFAEYFRDGNIRRHGCKREVKSPGVHDGPQVNHHGTFEVGHGDAEDGKPEEGPDGIRLFHKR